MTSPVREQKLEDTDGNVLIFGAHVANLLIQRSFQSFRNSGTHVPLPFIERFEGSLLFVDISGFTALSRQLHVESLKTHINAYFTKMLNVVDQYDGDVIKFAGDALYIIWPANALTDLATCVRKALLCALEIASVCNGYIICLDESQNWISPRFSNPSNLKTEEGSPGNCFPLRRGGSDDRFAFLNVHVGLSVGTMAAVDVGCAGRWELLLVGEPLNSVAVAENQAKSGEVVICLGAYRLLNVRRTFCADRMFRQRTSTASMLDVDLDIKFEHRGDSCYVVQTDSIFEKRDSENENDCGCHTPKNRLDFVDGVLREVHHNSGDINEDFSVWRTKDSQAQGKAFAMLIMKVSTLRSVTDPLLD